MIHVLKGTDRDAISKRITTLSLGKSSRRFGDQELALALDPLFSENLFGEAVVAVIDGVLALLADDREYVLGRVSAMKESMHIFVLVDDAWNAESLGIFKGVGVNPETFAVKEQWNDTNVFAISDALFARDKKQVWMIFTGLLKDGIAAEEVHGTIFWAIKSMLLAKNPQFGIGAEDLGMKPFVHQKASRGARNYSLEELASMAKSSIDLLEGTRKMGGDLGIAIEGFLLVAV